MGPKVKTNKIICTIVCNLDERVPLISSYRQMSEANCPPRQHRRRCDFRSYELDEDV